MKKLRMRWVGHVAHMVEKMHTYRIFVGKPEGKRPLGRPRCMYEGNIKMDLRKIGWRVSTGFIWFRIETSDRLFRLHKVLGNWVSSNYVLNDGLRDS
jgi:hypothetical protein